MPEDHKARRPMLSESFRLSTADLSALNALAGDQSRGVVLRQLIRRAADQLEPLPLTKTHRSVRRIRSMNPTDSRPPADPELIRQVARLSNLLDQIANELQVCRHGNDAVDLTVIYFGLLTMVDHLEYLRENYTLVAPANGASGRQEVPP